jgi:hypothetical protein
MAWSYNNTTTPGVLTSTGGTEASPDSLLAGISIVQAVNGGRAYRNGTLGVLQDVEVRFAGSFIRIDPDSLIDIRGTSFLNPGDGGVTHDYRSTLLISTTTSRIDNACDFETGSTLLARRERPNDPNPRIVYNTAVRHDYPNIQAGSTPAKVIIDGLDFYGSQSGGANLKVYFGRATISSVSNIRFFNLARAQQFSSTYNDGYFESLGLESEINANNIITHNRPTYYRAAPSAFDSAFRSAQVTLNNPTFLNNCWNGTVSFAQQLAESRLNLQYSYLNRFRAGLAAVTGVNVRFTRARQSVNGAPTWTAPNGVLTATADAQGTYTALNLLDAYREGTSGTNLERFNWTAKARSFNRRTAGETLFSSRVLYQHSVNMSAGYSEEVQMLDVAGLTLTQAQAAALTGIAFAASGTTGGTATITEPRTTAEIWAAYRNWISLTANFDSEDTWLLTADTLNTGAWNVVRNSVITGSVTTTGTITGTGSITGTATDSTGTLVTVRTADNLPLSTEILINGTPQGWVTGNTARTIKVQPSTVVRIYAHAYGYQPKIVNVTGNTASDYVLSLLPEVNVDTTLSSTTRNTIAAGFAVGVDAQSRLFLSVAFDMRPYAPADVLNALHYFTVNSGSLIALAALSANSVDGFALIRGGFIIRSPGFYGKVSDAVTEDTDMGIYVPLYVMVDPGVYTIDPTYTPVKKNSSGVVLGVALWTQQEADVPSWVAQEASVLARPTLAQIEASTVLAKEATLTALASTNQTEHDATQGLIAALPAPLNSTQTQAAAAAALTAYDAVVPADLAGLALEASVQTRASQTSVNAIPTNPLLTTDTRLNNLDAAVSTRSTLTAPQVRTELATELGRLDVAVSTRLASASYTAAPTVVQIRQEMDANSTRLTNLDTTVSSRATQASVTAIPTNPLLTTDTRLNNLDAAVSSRLATAGYTAPPTVAAIRADIERTGGMLDVLPTLPEMLASTLTKQADLANLATAANVTSAQTAIVGEVNANEVKIDAVKADTAAVKAKTDSITFTGSNVNSIAQVVSDKTGYALTTAERTAIANAVQAAILDENDGQAILAAIVAAIGNQNISQVALVAAIRTDLERAGGKLDEAATKTLLTGLNDLVIASSQF